MSHTSLHPTRDTVFQHVPTMSHAMIVYPDRWYQDVIYPEKIDRLEIRTRLCYVNSEPTLLSQTPTQFDTRIEKTHSTFVINQQLQRLGDKQSLESCQENFGETHQCFQGNALKMHAEMDLGANSTDCLFRYPKKIRVDNTAYIKLMDMEVKTWIEEMTVSIWSRSVLPKFSQ